MEPLKIFLKGQPGGGRIGAYRQQLGQGFHHRIGGAVEGTPPGNARDIAVGHGGSVVGFSLEQRDFRHHRLFRSQLVFSREGHQHGPRADAGVEPFGQPLLGAHLQALQVFLKGLSYRQIP